MGDAAGAVRERLAAARSAGVGFEKTWAVAVEEALADVPESDREVAPTTVGASPTCAPAQGSGRQAP